jgi:hypothetical protein
MIRPRVHAIEHKKWSNSIKFLLYFYYISTKLPLNTIVPLLEEAGARAGLAASIQTVDVNFGKQL